MDRGIYFYLLLGAGIALALIVTDRLLKDRVTGASRTLVALIVAVVTAAIIAAIASSLGL